MSLVKFETECFNPDFVVRITTEEYNNSCDIRIYFSSVPFIRLTYPNQSVALSRVKDLYKLLGGK